MQDGKAVEIGVADDVGDVAMNEDFSGDKTGNLVGGQAVIGATDPEIFGILLAGELGGKLGITLRDFGRLTLVLDEEIGQVRQG